jgi:hypothetical protein
MQREARISFQRPFWNDQSELFFWIVLLVVQGSRTFLSYLNVRADWRPVPVTSSPDVSRKESSKRNQTDPAISEKS